MAVTVDLYNLLAANRKALLAAGLLASNPAVVAIDVELAKHTTLSGKVWASELDEVIAVMREKVKAFKDPAQGEYNFAKLKHDLTTQIALVQSKFVSYAQQLSSNAVAAPLVAAKPSEAVAA
jgi:hypothetical protein